MQSADRRACRSGYGSAKRASRDRRIQGYVAELARHLRTQPRFPAALVDDTAGFDPDMFDAFLALEKRFRDIARQFPDDAQ